MPSRAPAYELPLRLLLGFRVMIDEVHTELARQGHPGVRPLHGFALQAIGREGTTASELGARLGVSKQAAGKTIDALARLGYVERTADDVDARRKIVRLTERGYDCLARSARSFERVRATWERELGAERLHRLEADLRRMTPDESLRVDMPGWFGGGDES